MFWIGPVTAENIGFAANELSDLTRVASDNYLDARRNQEQIERT